MCQKIIIINYGMGNLNSVKRKLERLNIKPIITCDAQTIANADKIILPGVGSFGKAMENLKKLNLIETLKKFALEDKKPVLGICLGMQLMCSHSEEGNATGLNWINADVIKFNVSDTQKYKVPHMGWNTVKVKKESKLMTGISNTMEFYFVHSFHLKMRDTSSILNTTTYDYSFSSAFEKENIFGVQYHPEKSHDAGTKLFQNFINL